MMYDPNDPYGLNQSAPRPGQQMLAQNPMMGMQQPPQGGAGMGLDPTADPAYVQALLKQQNQGLGNQLQHQRKMADVMRQGADSQMAGTRYGNGGFIAPGIGNLAASVLQTWRAGKLDKEAQGTAEGLDTANADTAGKWFTNQRRIRSRRPAAAIDTEPDY